MNALLRLNSAIPIAVAVLLLALPAATRAQANGFITISQGAPGFVTAELITDSLIGRPFNFLVTHSASGFEIQILTGFGDTGLPTVPRVVELGPLTADGAYTVTWIESYGADADHPGEQYATAFQLQQGVLVKDVPAGVPIPTLANSALAGLILVLFAFGAKRLRRVRVHNGA